MYTLMLTLLLILASVISCLLAEPLVFTAVCSQTFAYSVAIAVDISVYMLALGKLQSNATSQQARLRLGEKR
jgi:hypothetical protein